MTTIEEFVKEKSQLASKIIEVHKRVDKFNDFNTVAVKDLLEWNKQNPTIPISIHEEYKQKIRKMIKDKIQHRLYDLKDYVENKEYKNCVRMQSEIFILRQIEADLEALNLFETIKKKVAKNKEVKE